MAMARPVVAFDLIETRASAEDSALYAPQAMRRRLPRA